MLTSLDFLLPGQAWPPASEVGRLQRYSRNIQLWRGRHEQVFTDWVRLLRHDQMATLEFAFNLNRRLSTLWADLLVGEPPRFMAEEGPAASGADPDEQGDGAAQAAVDDLTERNHFATVCYEVAIDQSRFGDGLFKIILRDGKAKVQSQPPTYWFPVASLDDLKDIQYHVLAWGFTKTDPSKNPAPGGIGTILGRIGGPKSTTYLRVEIHSRGQIENRLYILNEQGNAIDGQVDLHSLFPNRQEIEQTGVDDFLVVPVSALQTSDSYYGFDDYEDLDSIIQELEIRFAQISRILDKHAEPSMSGPTNALSINPITGESELKGGGNYYPVDEGETAPQYLTWDGQLASAYQEIAELIKQFYVVSETSPAAFGQMDAGLATSGSALRRLMMAPLAKVNRIRLRFDPAVKQVLRLACELEQANGGGIAVPDSINIQWRDGLPEDPLEQAQIEQIREAAGNTSLYSSIKRLDGGTDDEIQEEIERIKDAAAQKAATNPLMPSLRLRFGNGQQPGATQTVPGTQAGNEGGPVQGAGQVAATAAEMRPGQ